jgi:hypothetical protein
MIGRAIYCTWRGAQRRNQVLRLGLIVFCVFPILTKIKTAGQIIKVYVFWYITLRRYVTDASEELAASIVRNKEISEYRGFTET